VPNRLTNSRASGLLIGASTADRFEVSTAIDVVLPLERLQELLRWLKAKDNAAAEQSRWRSSGRGRACPTASVA
jgi:hypothetical protein